MRSHFLFMSIACVVSANPALLRAAELLAGPLVGHTTSTSTRIWVETSEAAEIRVDYWQAPRLQYDDTLHKPIRRGSAEGRTNPDYPHTGVVELRDLQPGWLINYSVQIDGRAVRALSPQSVSLLPEVPSSTETDREFPEFCVAFGSCNFPARIPVQPIWAQVMRRRPAAFLFLGDNNYLPDTVESFATDPADLMEIYAYTHRALRNVAGVRELVASTPTYAIWDDHDFGPNNSDRTFPAKATSLEMFRRYWPNPGSGLPEVPGVFHSFRVVDAEFFLLDNRYHRDAETAPNRRTMLGREQLAWLKQRLRASTATFKVIANPGTVLASEGGETWTAYGSERDDFLAWLFREGISGVIFIAGDWHVGALHRLHRPQDAYPLYELLSSNLAVRIVTDKVSADLEGPGNNQWAAPYVTDYNFGLLRFAGPLGERTVTLQVIDEKGDIRIELRLAEADLEPARRRKP